MPALPIRIIPRLHLRSLSGRPRKEHLLTTIAEVLKVNQRARETQAEAARVVAQRGLAIREALNAGVSAVELAKALGVNRQRVYAMAKK